jgi:hypothetical protein
VWLVVRRDLGRDAWPLAVAALHAHYDCVGKGAVAMSGVHWRQACCEVQGVVRIVRQKGHPAAAALAHFLGAPAPAETPCHVAMEHVLEVVQPKAMLARHVPASFSSVSKDPAQYNTSGQSTSPWSPSSASQGSTLVRVSCEAIAVHVMVCNSHSPVRRAQSSG